MKLFFKETLLILLGLPLLICGCGQNHPPPIPPPKKVAAGPVAYHDASLSAGITYRWGHKSVERLTILDTIGHGCAFLDYDGDGKLDILLVGNDHCLLYRNKGDGTFEDVTDKAFPNAPRQPTLLGCSVADYDNDGRPDIYVSGYGRTILYHNEGNGTFGDVTSGSGLEARGRDDWTTSSAWADVDGDGKLEMYVCRYVLFNSSSSQLCSMLGLDGSQVITACSPLTYTSEKGSLYRNLGNGHFKDITQESGMSDAHGNALACMFCDFNDDGKPELYIANDQKPGDLYLSQGKGKYVNRAIESGVAYDAHGLIQSGMGIDWGDYNGDGRFDLLVADFASQPKSLYQYDGDGRFTQVSYPSGLGGATIKALAFGAAFVDVDNSGWPSIMLTNGHVQSEIEKLDSEQTYAQSLQLLLNKGGHFTDVSANCGEVFNRKIVGRGIAIGDYDGDGRMDMLIVDDEGVPLLLHNDSAPSYHWLTLKCENKRFGSPAVGARVKITAGKLKYIAEVRSSGSYLSSNSPDLHFGLGENTKIDSIQVIWPDGRKNHYSSVPVDQSYHLWPDAAALTN